MQVKSIAECSPWSILQYFWPSLSYYLSLRSFFCLFLNGRFTQALLYLESIEMDHVISESSYKRATLQRSYRKMTILWSFSYNSFVKFLGEKNWEPQHDHVI